MHTAVAGVVALVLQHREGTAPLVLLVVVAVLELAVQPLVVQVFPL